MKKKKNKKNLEIVEEKQELIVEKPKKQEKPEPAKITFDTWFNRKVAQKQLREWQAYQLEVFMEKHGLTGEHTEKEFEEVFEKY